MLMPVSLSAFLWSGAQIYFKYAKKRRSLLSDVAAAEAFGGYAYTGCTRSGTLTFVSAVKGTSGVRFPQYIYIYAFRG